MARWPCLVAAFVLCLVSFSDAAVTLDPPTAFVHKGQQVTVKCKLTGEDWSSWTKDGSSITQDSSAQTYVKKDAEKQYSLLFKSVTVNQGGKYLCRGSSGKTAEFNLKIAFDATKIVTTQNLRIGTDDKIIVDVYGSPVPTFEWSKNGKTFNPTGRFSRQSGGTLAVKDVEAADGGNYTVTISQSPVSQKVMIHVIAFDPPVMEQVPLPATRYLTVGFNTTFHCRAKGTPPPTYKWLNRLGNPVDITNPRFLPKGEYFHITNIQESDKGNYTCVASNAKGYTVSASAEIKDVYVRPTIQSQYIRDYIIERGERVNMWCVADGTPLPTVRWMRDGRLEHRQKVYVRKSLIEIKQARMMDMGKYQCEATNAARDQNGNVIVAEETIGMYIKSKPVLNKKGTQLTVYSYLGNPKPVYIRCNFEGYPFPNVTIWFDNIQIANGTEIAIFDIITNELEDFGDYYCWSWNLHGSTNVTVSLKHATAPSRPTNVKANVTCNSVELSWDFPKDYGGMDIAQYVIEYAGQTWNTEDTYPVYYIVNLKPNTVYTIKIQARNKMGVGDHETVTVTTSQYCKPSHPIIWHPRQKVINDNVFFLRWKEPANTGGDPNIRYKVTVSENIDGVPYSDRETEEIGVTEYFVDNLKFGMKYQVEVVAFNKGGYSDPAYGLYEIPKLAVMMARTGSCCLVVNAFTILLASFLTLVLTNL